MEHFFGTPWRKLTCKNIIYIFANYYLQNRINKTSFKKKMQNSQSFSFICLVIKQQCYTFASINNKNKSKMLYNTINNNYWWRRLQLLVVG